MIVWVLFLYLISFNLHLPAITSTTNNQTQPHTAPSPPNFSHPALTSSQTAHSSHDRSTTPADPTQQQSYSVLLLVVIEYW